MLQLFKQITPIQALRVSKANLQEVKSFVNSCGDVRIYIRLENDFVSGTLVFGEDSEPYEEQVRGVTLWLKTLMGMCIFGAERIF